MRPDLRCKLGVAVGFAAVAAACASSDATAPRISPPDPGAVLQQAREDVLAGRFAEALEKHQWFHEHALELVPAYRGVRLSFALSDWHRLGRLYPPAMQALQATSALVESRIRRGGGDLELVSELSAINRQLGRDLATAEVYIWLVENDPEFAIAAYRIVQGSLVRSQRYALALQYLDPAFETQREIAAFRNSLRMASDPRIGPRMAAGGRLNFINRSATLVALLAVNDRHDEAREAAAAFRAEWPSAELDEALASALQGVVPDPWP